MIGPSSPKPAIAPSSTFLSDDSDLWGRLDARRDACSGQKCPEFNQCFVTAMHQRAKDADLIIVNHHLFFADLALKQDDFGSILPEYSAVVFDEAHEMEDTASDYFGRQISNYRFEELSRDVDQTLRMLRLGSAALLRRTQRIRERSREFFDTFPPRDGRFPFTRPERAAFLETNREAYDALTTALKGLETEFAALTQKPEELTRLARRSFEIRQELSLPLRIQREKFRLLVRTPQQRRLPRRDSHRRQPDSARTSVRNFRHRRSDLRHAHRRRPLRIHPPARRSRSHKGTRRCRPNSTGRIRLCSTRRVRFPTCAIRASRPPPPTKSSICSNSARAGHSASSPAIRK